MLERPPRIDASNAQVATAGPDRAAPISTPRG
jgi:hypothetical protein